MIDYSMVLVRFGEIAIKSRQTRSRMVRILMSHIESALLENDIQFTRIMREYGRIFIETNQPDLAAEITSAVFGVVSCSPVVVLSSDLSEILDTGFGVAKEKFKKGKTFAVGSRRVGTHEFSSQDVRERLGEKILEGLPELELSVDLTDPEQSVYVEVRNDISYIFTETIDGVGGMPTGTQGKAVCTVSTGLDSPIAAYKVMKRGCIPVFVYFDNSPFCDDACTEVAIKQARQLASYIHGHEVKMYIVPHGRDLEEVQAVGPKKLTCVFCKRNMLRLAREIAIKEKADAIVTGEIIGEQASQTTKNLRVISSAVCDFPVLRPCAGDDKVFVEHLAMKIGTYQFAHESVTCCTLPPDYPSVKADGKIIQEAEEQMDLGILKNEVEGAEVIILREGK